MLILSLDSAGAGCSVCVWRDGKVLAIAVEKMERGQDQRLMPLILDVMKKTGVEFDALDRITVTRGPGSFTGLRIGLAAARGIGLAADKPVIGVDRFSIFHGQVKKSGKNLLVVIDSRRKELFCKFYPAQGAATAPIMMTAEEIVAFLAQNKNTIVMGDVSLPGTDFQEPIEPEVITAAALAAEADANDPAFLPRPLYLREADVTVKKSPVTVQPASLTHAPLLTEIHAASFGEAAWSLKQMQGSLALDTTRGWVALEGNKPSGFILCQMTPEQSEILTFAVHPNSQRRGAGRKLVQTAIDTASACGTGRIFLEVAADNQAARALYEKLGFRESGIRANYYRRRDGVVDAVFYEKSLGNQDLHKEC